MLKINITENREHIYVSVNIIDLTSMTTVLCTGEGATSITIDAYDLEIIEEDPQGNESTTHLDIRGHIVTVSMDPNAEL